MGVYGCVKYEGEQGDPDFFEKNCGEGKFFPGGPKCVVRGIEIHCFIHWSKKESITSDILKEALEELDHLNVFPQSESLTPFLLVN